MDSDRLSLTELQFQLSRDPETYRNDLYRCKDKELRRTLRAFMIGEIKRLNKKQKSLKVNSVYVPAVRFLLGKEKLNNQSDSDSDSDSNVNDETKIKQLRLGFRVGNKTKGRKNRLDRSIKTVNKDKERKTKKDNKIINFHALNMLHDPQSFAERLFRKLERCSDRFEVRLLILELISLLIGLNKLLLLNYYPFIQRFLRPHQKELANLFKTMKALKVVFDGINEVTHLLLFSAQASHDQLPPDVIEPVVRTIADNFITERASSEAIAVGLNSVREVCARCPYAVNQDLLSDLIQYRSYRNKNVVAAARSIIRLYRQINPKLLPRKDRGRPTESQVDVVTNVVPTDVALEFGQVNTVSMVPGAEVVIMNRDKVNLVKNKKKEQSKNKTKDVEDEWVSCESGSNSDFDEDEMELDDDDDDNDVQSTNIEINLDNKIEKSTNGRLDRMVDSECLKAQALELASTRLFTQEEFETMRKHQQAKQKRFASYSSFGAKKRKQNSNDDEDDDLEGSDDEGDRENDGMVHGLVRMNDITRLVKRIKQTKAERLQSIEEGRAGREHYGYKVNRQNTHASTTNREKSKNKTFQMIKHKVRTKCKRSFQQKQNVLREHLRKLAKQSR